MRLLREVFLRNVCVFRQGKDFFFLDFYLVYQREVALFLAVIRIWVRPCVCVCLQRAEEETVEEARVQDPINQQIG